MNLRMLNAIEGLMMHLRLLLAPAATTLSLGALALVMGVGESNSQSVASAPDRLAAAVTTMASESPMMDESWPALGSAPAAPPNAMDAAPAVVPANATRLQAAQVSHVPRHVLGHDQWLVSASIRQRLDITPRQVDWATLSASLDADTPSGGSETAEASTAQATPVPAHRQLAAARARAAAPLPPRKPQGANDVTTRLAVVQRGQTLGAVLINMGVAPGRVLSFLEDHADTINTRSLPAGQRIEVDLVPAQQGLDIAALRLPRGDTTVVATADPSALRAQAEVVAAVSDLDTDKVYKRFAIQGSVIASARRAGIPADVVTQLLRAEGWQTDLESGVQPNQVMEVMFEQLVDNTGKTVRIGDIQYASLWHGSRREEVFRYVGTDGRARLVSRSAGEASCRESRQRINNKPLDQGRITSNYGWRWHPILRRRAMHKGVDYGAPRHTPIRAAADGVVESRRWASGYGRLIVIRHDDRLSTAYAHMQAFKVREGQRVRRGQIIGTVGSSGWSTGPHLHFEIRVNGQQRDPLRAYYVNQEDCGPQVDPERLSNQVAQITRSLSSYRSNAQFADAGG